MVMPHCICGQPNVISPEVCERCFPEMIADGRAGSGHTGSPVPWSRTGKLNGHYYLVDFSADRNEVARFHSADDIEFAEHACISYEPLRKEVTILRNARTALTNTIEDLRMRIGRSDDAYAEVAGELDRLKRRVEARTPDDDVRARAAHDAALKCVPVTAEVGCPEDCAMCSGEACNKCGAGRVRFGQPDGTPCEHDHLERHEGP